MHPVGAASGVGVGAAAEQAWNAAALACPVRAPAWRLWVYREPAVVLGCSQRAQAALAPAAGLEILVRDSGGGAVLVGPWMLGLSAVLPGAHPLVAGGTLAGYRWLGVAIALALLRIGVSAEAVEKNRLALCDLAVSGEHSVAAVRRDWACFGSLSPWEVVARGRKIAGLAQRRQRHGVLLAAGVLLQAPPWVLLCERLGMARSEALRLAQASTSCAEELPDVELASLSSALKRSLHEAVETALA